MTENKLPLIDSINVGKAKEIAYMSSRVATAIGKQPVQGAVRLSTVNFDGDEQADLIHHGGANKAVCVYSRDHYPYWEEQLQRTLEAGAFGENLTIQGAVETDFQIGDIYRIGTALVQVSQPRHPCFKLAAKYGVKELPALVLRTGFTGFYLRVLEEGTVSAGDSMLPIETKASGYSIADVNRITFGNEPSIEEMRSLLLVETLADEWRLQLHKRLESLA
jgi:MOSC domain-containing protein YiiM